MAEDIHDQVGDMASLLDDFLSFNVTRNQHVDDEPLTVGEILSGVDLDGVSNTIDETLMVRGDALRIRQIIRNLVRNAQIHGGHSVRLKSTRDEGTVAIQVIDDGPGVPGDVLESLFQPFSHGARSGSLGLGLAVSQKLARTMGGDLTHRREAGSTVFELVLRSVPAI
jgi:signal transduction histidine kinase